MEHPSPGTASSSPGTGAAKRHPVKWIGLIGGPIAAVALMVLLPDGYTAPDGTTVALTYGARATLGAMAWMAVWWLSEAIDVAATALVPLAIFPLFGILPIGPTAAQYGHELIFLFFGGFVLALSLQRWGLDRRIALLTLRMVGTKPANMIAGFMLATAVLSMWVSNTATAAMMLPIGLSVIDLVLRRETGRSLDEHGGMPDASARGRNFGLSLMLGIAYAASIGGIGTVIGSPPNGILVGFLESSIDEAHRVEVSFFDWMLIGLPIVAIFLPIAWALITWVLYPIRIAHIEGGRAFVRDELAALGRMNRGEWATFIVFMLTATAWITRPILQKGIVSHSGDVLIPPIAPGLSDGGIAMLAAVALFVIPVRPARREFAMNWHTARKLPWGVLILFGGGLALAEAVQANGVAEFFASLVAGFDWLPAILLILLIATVVIFLTELTSNTATTATLVPILAGIAPGLGVHPYMLLFPATIAASCAFMMPVATPPNAIVFSSGMVTIPQMCKAGFWLNIAGIIIVTLAAYTIVVPLLRVTL